jgi:L-lactate dehydrogenase complex protein LldG
MSGKRASHGPQRATQDVHEFLRYLEQQVQPLASPTALPDEPVAALREATEAEDCVARFVREAADAGCVVHQVTQHTWIAEVADILRGHSARNVVVEPLTGSALPAPRAAELREALVGAGMSVIAERDDETLFNADAAVTGVVAAIAETGTIVCASGAETARGTSLIPPVHVALVGATQIVPDLLDYFARLGRDVEPPANVNLITGPSKTADIEGILITGVHGPGTVHVLVVE